MIKHFKNQWMNYENLTVGFPNINRCMWNSWVLDGFYLEKIQSRPRSFISNGQGTKTVEGPAQELVAGPPLRGFMEQCHSAAVTWKLMEAGMNSDTGIIQSWRYSDRVHSHLHYFLKPSMSNFFVTMVYCYMIRLT